MLKSSAIYMTYGLNLLRKEVIRYLGVLIKITTKLKTIDASHVVDEKGYVVKSEVIKLFKPILDEALKKPKAD
jgi:hypothetical protein